MPCRYPRVSDPSYLTKTPLSSSRLCWLPHYQASHYYQVAYLAVETQSRKHRSQNNLHDDYDIVQLPHFLDKLLFLYADNPFPERHIQCRTWITHILTYLKSTGVLGEKRLRAYSHHKPHANIFKALVNGSLRTIASTKNGCRV